ncbi:MAG: nucleotidyltransferase family protein [Ignavibacteria bacterium]|jgi:predicted nucleotidyltransferase|nr:nucleotidyltransferase family protein [Ignavibacteria bacterium]MBK7158531.1 nucleotidyltransferase family protein [Ignavibacteria bacterium]MBK8383539.1 nucleotidyltransferase family protein [Ignavibacteria bacterium]MBK9403363.1 nucleotidyltransferase family protein [Ignavibacteria bacterium]MBL0107517.1 nucleotidyltransferase family protein [Ignavibacteria bacterium]
MISITELESKLKNLKPILSEKYSVNKIGYFGSYSRNEQKKYSDIDILVNFEKPVGWEFFDLQDLLEKELNTKVDLLSTKAIKDLIKNDILKQAIYI